MNSIGFNFDYISNYKIKIVVIDPLIVRKLINLTYTIWFFIFSSTMFLFKEYFYYRFKRNLFNQPLIDNSKLHGDLSNCVCLVTGCVNGVLGHQIVKQLIQSKCHLLITIHGDQKYIEQAKINLINNELKHVDPSQFSFEELDMTSFKSIIQLIKKLNKNEQKINFVISNAGSFFNDIKVTKDGFENQLQINYLGACLLLIGLLPLLNRTAKLSKETNEIKSKIIFTNSNAHYMFNFDLNQVDYATNNFKEKYNSYRMYASTKLFQIMFNVHFFDKIIKRNGLNSLMSLISVHPGSMKSGISVIFAKTNPILYKMCMFLLKTPEEGAQNIIAPIISNDEIFNSTECLYLEELKVNKTGQCSMDKNSREKLYQKTLSLLRDQIEQLDLPNHFNPLLS